MIHADLFVIKFSGLRGATGVLEAGVDTWKFEIFSYFYIGAGKV